LREAALESAGWVVLSLGFGAWIFVSHGDGPGLEFFTGYVIEKSLSVDNVFVFLLIFQYFRVDPRYQHRLLFWGVLGALILRGVMIGAGAVLIERFDWVLYIFGAFLIYSGFKLFGANHAVHPENNPLVRWAQKFLPMTDATADGKLVLRQGGRWLFTPLFLVVIVLETTDLVLAVDSIPAVFGVTRDPFLVYSSNVCAILGLRALFFLLAGVLQYFQYLDEGLAITVMFIGAKMLASPWVHISTGLSLAIVGGIIGLSILISIVRVNPEAKPPINPVENPEPKPRVNAVSVDQVVARADSLVADAITPEFIAHLADGDPAERAWTASRLFTAGQSRTRESLQSWERDEELRALMVQQPADGVAIAIPDAVKLTVGVAVLPKTFEKIRAMNGVPPLADAPADQDVLEFELEYSRSGFPQIRLDILTTKAPGGNGAIARFLGKFGEGIQQVELDVTNVDRATEILRTRFKLEPIYPETRPGANGTRVNFFLVPAQDNRKVLLELVEYPRLK
jgi:tellurite resistance protein TerC